MPRRAMSPTEAHTIIAQAQAERAEKCRQAIQATLTRHQCIMVPEIIITGNQITASVRILARPIGE